ncbi:uncharacterized protein LOC134716619 [Mytilus trossulus]|uniref:uncharacterized protein LOC134716619 n=1 Tax=Mytilus trossulus TaxID=6551 RepID=UPI003005B153
MRELPVFFPGVPRLGLSATITTKDETDVIPSLGMTNPAVVRAICPDRKNIYLQIKVKEPSLDIYDWYQNLYKPICNDLLKNPDIFPVTLFFMPLQYIGNAASYFVEMDFNSPSIKRVRHDCPPRSLSDYIQEIGRAGRTGKDSTPLLHYCNRDVAANVKDIKDDIIKFTCHWSQI